MPSYRYPVLVWEDGEGYFNACPVETDEPVGLGRTTSEALRQVEEGLAWVFGNGLAGGAAVGGAAAGRGGAGLVVRERLADDARLGRAEPGAVPALGTAAIPDR